MSKRYANAAVVNDAYTNADAYSAVTDIRYLDNVSYQYIWDGTLTGTCFVQASNNWDAVHEAGNFVTLSNTTTNPAGSAGSSLINLNQLPYAYVRAGLEYTSGDGYLTIQVNAKSI